MTFSKMLGIDKSQILFGIENRKISIIPVILIIGPCTDFISPREVWQSTKEVADMLTRLCEPSVQVLPWTPRKWEMEEMGFKSNIVRAFVSSQRATYYENILPILQSTTLLFSSHWLILLIPWTVIILDS